MTPAKKKNCPKCKDGTMILIQPGVLVDVFQCDKCSHKVRQTDMIQVGLG